MIKNDYILRIIEELALFVAKIIGLKRSGGYEEAIQTVDGAMKKLLGLNPETVWMLSYQDLISMMYTEKRVGAAKALALARLIKEKAGVMESSGKDGYNLYLKSLNIYLNTALSDEENIDRCREDVDELYSAILKNRALPQDTMHMLFKYFENTGRYSSAEDMLFHLIDDGDLSMVDEGMEFYSRLLDTKPEKLQDGNLPVDEVKDGLSRLIQYKDNYHIKSMDEPK